MKKILFAATVLCMMGCQNKPTNSTPALDPSNMDTSVAPNESFYQYATGGWQAKNPLKPEHSSYNMFNVLSDNNEIRINELFTQMTKENPAKGTVNQKIADLYKLGLDSVRLNKEGAAPVKAELETILSLDKKEQLTPILSVMQLTSSSPLFSFGPQADLKDSKVNALYIEQSGIGMGDRDYYLDAENESIREAYKTYLNRLFTLAGLEESQVSKATDAVMRIETELAKNMRSNVELRDLQRMYNPMATADLKKNYDAIDWKYLFDFAKINPERVIVCQPEYMEALDKLIEITPIEDLRYYLASQYLNAAAPYLDDNFYAASFDFYGRTMSGKQEPRPRWKRAMAIPNSALGEAVGEMYVEKFFPAEDKARMMTLVENLRTALGQHIDQLDWMSDSTKMRAREKLAAFHVKIGYPDKWKDYSTLEIDPTLSYWENIQRASEWATRDQLAKVGKAVDPEEWLMTPQTVNAYYNPTTNEICFPAAILQPPFFNPDAEDAANYGGIGAVIGHEIGHGFDDQGSQYDGDGKLNDWWTEEDKANFKALTQKLIDQYNEFVPTQLAEKYSDDPSKAPHVNGALTIGENIGDLSGVNIALKAYAFALDEAAGRGKDGSTEAIEAALADAPEIDGFTGLQRFFLSYASIWRTKNRDELAEQYLQIDPHSPAECRTNGIARNVDLFHKAFGVQPGDGMWLAPEQRVRIW